MGIVAALKLIAPLTFYVGGFLLAAAAVFGKARWTFLLLVFLIPLRNIVDKVQQFPAGNQLMDMLIGSMLLGWIFSVSFSNKKFMEKSSLNISVFLLMVYMLISVVVGSNYIQQNDLVVYNNSRITDAKNFCLLPIVFFLTLNHIQDKKWVWRVFLVMCAAMLLMGYYTSIQVSMYSSLLSRAKITGTFKFLGPNEVAAFLNQYTIILVSVYFFMKRGWPKWAVLGLIFVNLYSVLFLFSRGAYFGLAIGMMLLFAFKNRKLLIPLFLVIAFWQVVLPEKAIERIQSTKNEYGQLDESAERRVRIWEKAIEIFKESPVVGIGFGVFRNLGLDLGDTHNIYIKILVEQGILGFLIFCLVILSFMREGFVLYQKGEDDMAKGLGLGLFVCMFVLLCNNMFGDRWSYFELSGYLWIFGGLAARLNALARESSVPQTVQKAADAPVKDVLPQKKIRKSYYK